MPVRGIVRSSVVRGVASETNAPLHVDSDDNIPYLIPAGTGSSLVPFVLGLTGVTGAKIAGGSGVLVAGTLVVATGLAGVKGFSANMSGSPVGTGAAGGQVLFVTATSATGAVTVDAFYISTIGASGALVAATGSTGTFLWTAFGV